MRSHQDPALLRAFAAELKARRDKLDLTQEHLAHDAGVNRTFVARLELAKTSPSLTTLYRLAEGLRVEPTELVKSISKRYKREKAHPSA